MTDIDPRQHFIAVAGLVRPRPILRPTASAGAMWDTEPGPGGASNRLDALRRSRVGDQQLPDDLFASPGQTSGLASQAGGELPRTAIKRLQQAVGNRAANRLRPAAEHLNSVPGQLIRRMLTQALPVGEFRKADLPKGIEQDISDSVKEMDAQKELLAGRYRLLAELGFALPKTDELMQAAEVAAALSSTLTGRFSAAKRDALVRGYTRVRAAEQADLAHGARLELDAIYPLAHIPSGRTLNKLLKDIFLAADAADEYIGYAFLKKYIDKAPIEERKAAGANPRLIELATKRLAGRDDFPAFAIQLSIVLKGSIAHYKAEEADEIIRAKMKDWVPDVAIAGKSIAGSVAVLKGDAWEKVLRKYQVGKVPESMIRDTIETANAFTAPDGKVFISADRGNPGTMIHEGIHFYAPDQFLQVYGIDLNEGVTEYFARKITNDLGIERTQYRKELLAALELVDKAGEDVVMQAYFAGDTDRLKGVGIPEVTDDAVSASAADNPVVPQADLS